MRLRRRDRRHPTATEAAVPFSEDPVAAPRAGGSPDSRGTAMAVLVGALAADARNAQLHGIFAFWH